MSAMKMQELGKSHWMAGGTEATVSGIGKLELHTELLLPSASGRPCTKPLASSGAILQHITFWPLLE